MRSSNIQDDRSGASDCDAPEQTLRDAASHFSELKAYFAHYLAAKTDSVKVSIRRAVVFAALGVLGLVAGVAVIATAVVLVLHGLAQALTVLIKGHAWAGNLVAGVLVLGLIGLGTWLGVRRMF
jgi:hypothetical protein